MSEQHNQSAQEGQAAQESHGMRDTCGPSDFDAHMGPIIEEMAVCQTQPRPVLSDKSEPVLPLVLAEIAAMGHTPHLGGYAGIAARCYEARIRMGAAKYGEPMHTFNGRSPSVDVLQEVLDGFGYLVWWRREREQRGLEPLEALERAQENVGLLLGDMLEALHIEAQEAQGLRVTDAGGVLLHEVQESSDPAKAHDQHTIETLAGVLWGQVPQDGRFVEVHAAGGAAGLTEGEARCAALWLVGPYGEPDAVLRSRKTEGGRVYLLARKVLPGMGCEAGEACACGVEA